MKIAMGNQAQRNVDKACLKGYQIKKFIGKGAFGTVLQACKLKDRCSYVMKMIDFASSKQRRTDFDREVRYSSRLSKEHIGPKYYLSWICDDVGFLVTEKWDGELPRGVTISAQLSTKLYSQVQAISNMGLVHGDILEKNVLIKRDATGKITNVTIADFGLMRKATEIQQSPTWVETLYKYHTHQANNTRFYFKERNISLKDVKRNPYHLDLALVFYLFLRLEQ